jgi:outer membrane lipoprotein-sorting protein
MMKKILMIILMGFVFLGCTKKLQTDIKPYITMYQNNTQKVKVNFQGVNDQRDTKIVSTVLNKGEIKAQYPISNDLKTWYTQALKRELTNTNLYDENKISKINISVNIKEIKATYKEYSLDKKNMKISIKIELVIEKGHTAIKSNININQSTYKPMILDAEGFTDILNESMRDSVSKIVAVIIKKL